jgi:enamine deaminase RidA (YjgF/YER057c/UK114 family)
MKPSSPTTKLPREYISSDSPWEAMAGYSRAVAVGDWVFVSGTIGIDQKTQIMPEGAQAQAEQAFDTIETALLEARASLLEVVRVRVYVPDRADVAAVSGVVKKRLGAARATNTTICAPLAVDGARVEIEVTAIRDSQA